jgi:EpsD family peptidyl-prolyl cis-trans isomerase
MNFFNNRFALSLLTAALALGLSACGKKDETSAATQVAAKVGSEEITVHQLNQVLSRAAPLANTSPQAAKAMSRDVLEKLIDQQLAVDRATEDKLQRSPDVVSQLESSRRDILARAYLQKIVAALPKPTPEEAQKYYSEHPELFAQRRVFNMQEIAIAAVTPELVEEVRAQVASGKPLEEIAAWLKAKDIKFGGNSATRAAEQIPLALLAQIQKLKDGQTAAIQGPEGLTLLRIVSSQSAPVAQTVALPRIEQFLSNQRANEAVASNMKQLRTDAKITYMGEFAKSDAAAGTKSAATPAASASAAVDPAKAALEKGVAGLK